MQYYSETKGTITYTHNNMDESKSIMSSERKDTQSLYKIDFMSYSLKGNVLIRTAVVARG